MFPVKRTLVLIDMIAMLDVKVENGVKREVSLIHGSYGR